jgi:hypothetical protein
MCGDTAKLDTDGTGLARHCCRDLGFGECDCFEHLTRRSDQRLTCGGERDRACVAIEQARAQLGLKRLNGAAQGSLRDKELLSGPSEMKVFGDGQEGLQLSDIHHWLTSIRIPSDSSLTTVRLEGVSCDFGCPSGN